MAADDASGGALALSHDQLLDELDFLASVEHALCVEYLSVHCALGHGLDPADETPEAARVHEAAQAASSSAFAEMRHVHIVNRALVEGGRRAQLDRASSIQPGSGPAIPLGPPSPEQLERLVEHEREVSAAVDERWERLRSALASDPVLGREFPTHSGLAAALYKDLEHIPSTQYLRATHREPSDEIERSLLDLSDRYYALLVATLQIWFDHENELFGIRSQAIDTMTKLDGINRMLVERGLLPSFTF
jgi:hypothetical protein